MPVLVAATIQEEQLSEMTRHFLRAASVVLTPPGELAHHVRGDFDGAQAEAEMLPEGP